MKKRNIYVASSWRNQIYPDVVYALRSDGHEVYDFREKGFAWSEISENWQDWNLEDFKLALKHPLARMGFQRDADAMADADTCVMVLPCGNSAHIEAGYFVGCGNKELYIFAIESTTPDLMYLLANDVITDYETLCRTLAKSNNTPPPSDRPIPPRPDWVERI